MFGHEKSGQKEMRNEMKRGQGIVRILILAVMLCLAWVLSPLGTAESFAAANYESEVNNTVSKANAIATGREYTGAINQKEDVDFYRFKLTKDGMICVSFRHQLVGGSGQCWQLSLLGTDQKTEIYRKTFQAGEDLAEKTAEIGLPAGTYFLKVEPEWSWNEELIGKRYQFQVNYKQSSAWEKEENDSFGTATELKPGVTFSGSCMERPQAQDEDYYRFTLKTAGHYALAFTHGAGTNARWRIEILDRDKKTVLTEKNVYEGDGDTRVVFPELGLPAGTFYIHVNGSVMHNDNNDITYKLVLKGGASATWEQELNETVGKANAVKVDTAYTGTFRTSNDNDCYKFTLSRKAAVSLTFWNSGSSSLRNVQLLNRDQKTVLLDRNVGEGTSKETTERVSLAAGTYYVKVTHDIYWNGEESNQYRIRVNTKADVAEAQVSGLVNKAYTGKAITQKPVVVIDGTTLQEGTDYVLSYQNNVEPGTATVTIAGKGSYNGSISRKFKITNSYVRLAGANRYETAYEIANRLKKELGVLQFENICVADGRNYPDALAGAYLAKVKHAPILVTNDAEMATTALYIRKNLKKGGTVYILGGTGSVSGAMEKQLSGIKVKRLGGATRYETNLLILKEAKVTTQDFIVTTGTDYRDALSASATGRPVLLVVGKGLTASQKEYLLNVQSLNYDLVGGTEVIDAGVEKDLRIFGNTARISGSTYYQRSVNIARKYFPGEQHHINLAGGENYADALCGGPLATAQGGPLILATDTASVVSAAKSYAVTKKAYGATVFGGAVWVSDQAAKTVMSLN